MSQSHSPIIGSVIERRPTSKVTTPQLTSGKTGFPSVQHRSKSAFSKSRQEIRKTGQIRPVVPPPILPRPRSPPTSPNGTGASPPRSEDWREQISKENEERMAGMSPEEIEEEKRQILERFGSGIEDVLKRARQAREKQMAKGFALRKAIVPREGDDNSKQAPPLIEVPITRSESPVRAKSPSRGQSPPPALQSATRPSSRLDRKLRFAELHPDDVHVYESAPPSPHRRVLALPAPTPEDNAISIGTFRSASGKMILQPVSLLSDPLLVKEGHDSQSHQGDSIMKSEGDAIQKITEIKEKGNEPEEGTAEYIRRLYFPDAPVDDPNLAWMQSTLPPSDTTSSSLRFDLHGNPISPHLSSTLPTHLGLHHHAEGSHAGYTLDDVFLLSRSTVPAQRATMFGVLAGIARNISKVKSGEGDGLGMDEVFGKEEDIRKRIIAAGVEAMSERGSVGMRAIEVIWACVVGWDESIIDVEGVELESPSDAAIASIPLDFFLPQISTIFSQGDAAPETHSSFLTTQRLLNSVIQTFLLTPIPPTVSSPLPDPSAIQLLITLASSSRANAKSVEEVADPLLRFIAFNPTSSPFPASLSVNLITYLLELYETLASYGFYAHIATTAIEQFTNLTRFILSGDCTSNKLKEAWSSLLEIWITCAIDPHHTTPDHDILWSQVAGWGWSDEVFELQKTLKTTDHEWPLWAKTWHAQAAWLEGSKVNSIKGGEGERLNYVSTVKEGFESGREKAVVDGALQKIYSQLSHLAALEAVQLQSRRSIQALTMVGVSANVISAVIRVWLACLTPHTAGPPKAPPFALPFSRISELCAKLLTHPFDGVSYNYVFCRPLSGLVSYYLRLSRRIPDISEDLWMAQSLSILSRLMVGDEDFANQVVENLVDELTPNWAKGHGLRLPPRFECIKPFLSYTMRSVQDVHVGPIPTTVQALKKSTTQRLPPPSKMRGFGLPLYSDWTTTPLDHLLRSGDSEVLKSLPNEWDVSEVDIARGSLFFTKVASDALQRFSLYDFVLSREEMVFACMKIFMLEHGQPQNDSAEEVFRDAVVSQLMEDLVAPYTFGVAEKLRSKAPAFDIPAAKKENIEQVAVRFLGPSVPFYQYYTDFVALYDAISFSHPLFARFLLFPTSMCYPLDYRKHLWNDFNHLLRTIRTPFDQVISGDLREYLYPVENDPQLIASYLRAVLKNDLQGFAHLVSLHHISSNIWPDQEAEHYTEERSNKLLKAIVGQGSNEVIRQVVLYQQSRGGSLRQSPLSYDSAKIRDTRLDYIKRWGDKSLVERLDGLFKQ
ncbi:hypothetical protein BDQ17DRAFT_1368247 [Cyathus striatus]|nr:hypothetical protein BDQ17DRAFT_1368247 [Cyathus striatus]